MFDDSGMPFPDVFVPLLDAFFRTVSQHFPSISRKRMDERLETGTMSAFLANSESSPEEKYAEETYTPHGGSDCEGICAISAR
jgi:hypothetical protein